MRNEAIKVALPASRALRTEFKRFVSNIALTPGAGQQLETKYK